MTTSFSRYETLKRILDVLVAVPAVALLSPLFVVTALFILAESPGPVFYEGERVGRGGRPFRMLKFRTMVRDAESKGGSSTADGDSRITRSGRLLRRYKIDELPQLINIVRGEMSLVGPRPQVAFDVAKYTQEERRILDLTPGITDWASIRFHNEGEILRGLADPDQGYIDLIRPEKIRLSLKYADERSLRTDIKIIFLTLMRLAGREVRIP